MSIQLSHIAIAVPNLEEVLEKLKVLSLSLETIHEVPTEKVKAAMVPVEFSEHFKIELLEPTSDESPISRFLEKHSKGGMHHLCFEVNDLEQWEKKLTSEGIQVIAPGIRKAARGKALFIHPKEMAGVLVELEEIQH